MLLREIAEDVEVYTFSNQVTLMPPRHGFALAEAIKRVAHGGTYLGQAVDFINKIFIGKSTYDRLIVITDEQAHDTVPAPKGLGYMVNVAPYHNGVGYGKWIHIDGWSEAIVSYITEFEELTEE